MTHIAARRTITAAAAALLLALLLSVVALMTAASASAQVYPPVAPTATRTAVPPGPQVQSDTQVLGSKLASTGSELLPYVAAGGVLVLVGGVAVRQARRRQEASHL